MTRAARADLALDGEAVLELVSDAVSEVLGARPRTCRPRLLKRSARRIVVRYELEANGRRADVVGKWYATDRGRLVADALASLRANGFTGERRVPAPIAYLHEVRALFVEAVDGPLLREALREDQELATGAGAWLAAFHASAFTSPRSCGPEKQVGACRRWGAERGELAAVAREVAAAVASLDDPRGPVHYDYYHSQILVPPNETVVLDLDEAGLGDPAFDLEHFDVHLELLALQWFGDSGGFRAARAAFRRAYAAVAPLPGRTHALRAFAWLKVAHQLVARRASAEDASYALDAVRRSLSSA